MSNSSMQVTLNLNKQLSFIHTSHQNNHASFEDILETLTVEECREIILKSVQSTDIKPITIEALVKKVIDAFDLYVLLPGIDAPQSEYDTESHRIAENIAYGMSVMDIATVIKDVFDYYFDAHYSVRVYMEPANQIHTYLNHIHQNKPKTKGNFLCI